MARGPPADVGRDSEHLQSVCDHDSGDEEGLPLDIWKDVTALAHLGYGYDDICVKLRLGAGERRKVKRIVLGR